MKNRKTILVAFMLVACMVVGVGYAALSTELSITGNATFKADQAQNEFSGDIYFSETAVIGTPSNPTPAGTDTAVRTSDKAMDIAINSLSVKGDTTSFTFTIENSSLEHDANLSIKTLKFMGVTITDDNSDGVYEGEWLDAKVEWIDGTTLSRATDETTPSTAQLKITFTLKKSPTETVVRSINIAIDATTSD